jgi:hypothetical protein
MDKSNRHLVVLDFPGIKQFIFNTSRLVEIRGASALLDQLNRKVVPEFISEAFGPSRSQCVFAAGGSAQFIIDAPREKITGVFHQVEGEVARQSGGGLRIITGTAFYDRDYPGALQRAFLDLDKQKRQIRLEQFLTNHNGFVRDCESCSGMAETITRYGDTTRLLCAACAVKEKKGRERGLWNAFAEYAAAMDADPEAVLKGRPGDFQDIGERCRARRGYAALVYGDGNALGRIVKQIAQQAHFEHFSKAVDEAVRESCHEALWRHCKMVDKIIPADILLLGGDDLMVFLSADAAMPFAIEIARLFEEKTLAKLSAGDQDGFFKTLLGGKGLTLSMGVAYAKSHTPVALLVDQAEELLASAKKKGAALGKQGGYTPACIDFHPSSRFNQASVEQARRQNLIIKTSRGEILRLHQAPYTLQEAQALMIHAAQLKNSGIPRSRLHRLGEAPFKGKANAMIETLSLYSRCAKMEQRQTIRQALDDFNCFALMPWREEKDEISTVLVDMVEIAQFIAPGKEKQHHVP